MSNEFNDWNKLKQKLDNAQELPFFNKRDIWWCSVGINIGHEQNGKNEQFERPMLIIKKFNHRLFWGVPLTTQIKNIHHYHKFTFKNIVQCAMLTQMRLLDSKRLTRRIGRMSEKEFEKIRTKLKDYI